MEQRRVLGQQEGTRSWARAGGDRAVSQVGHTQWPFPHTIHGRKKERGRWENASSELPGAPGVLFVGQSRVLCYCKPQQNPSLPPTPAAVRTWISQGFWRGRESPTPDLISSRQLTAADEPAVSWQGEEAKAEARAFPGTTWAARVPPKEPPQVQRGFSRGIRAVPGSRWSCCHPEAHPLVPQRLFLVAPEMETPPKRPRRRGGKARGREGGLAARPFFGPLSEPTKAALLDEPGRASAAPAAR